MKHFQVWKLPKDSRIRHRFWIFFLEVLIHLVQSLHRALTSDNVTWQVWREFCGRVEGAGEPVHQKAQRRLFQAVAAARENPSG